MRRLDFEKIALVERFADHLVHVVWLIGIGRDDRIKAGLKPVPRISSGPFGHRGAVALRQEIDQVARTSPNGQRRMIGTGSR